MDHRRPRAAANALAPQRTPPCRGSSKSPSAARVGLARGRSSSMRCPIVGKSSAARVGSLSPRFLVGPVCLISRRGDRLDRAWGPLFLRLNRRARSLSSGSYHRQGWGTFERCPQSDAARAIISDVKYRGSRYCLRLAVVIGISTLRGLRRLVLCGTVRFELGAEN